MMKRQLRSLTVLLVALSLGCSNSNTGPVQTDWDSWPSMTADIPASIQLAARLGPGSTSSNAYSLTLTFTNSANDTASVSFGACSFGVRLYADTTGRGQPAWDDRPPPNSSCILPLYVVPLAPHTKADRQVASFDAAAAAKILAPGRYRVAVTWRASAADTVQAVLAGNVTLP